MEEQTRRFTPKTIHTSLCMARVWNEGYGAQCSRTGVDWPCGHFCSTHAKEDQWRVHGRVDGPIPEAKLREFVDNVPLRDAMATGGSEKKRERHRHALARKDDILAQPEADPARRRKREEGGAAPAPAGPESGRRGGEEAPERAPKAAKLEILTKEGLSRMELGAIADLVANPPEALRIRKYLLKWSLSDKGILALRSIRGGQWPKERVILDVLRRQERVLLRPEAGAPPRARGAPGRPAAAAPAGAARAAPRAPRPPEPRAPGRPAAPAPGAAGAGRRAVRAPWRPALSEWARRRVEQVAEEVALLPLEARASLLKKRAALFHPDKLEGALRSDAASACGSADERREVFEELMQRRRDVKEEISVFGD